MVEQESEDLQIEIVVNGVSLGMLPFVRRILSSTVLGMVAALKGGEDAREIEIRVKRKR